MNVHKIKGQLLVFAFNHQQNGNNTEWTRTFQEKIQRGLPHGGHFRFLIWQYYVSDIVLIYNHIKFQINISKSAWFIVFSFLTKAATWVFDLQSESVRDCSQYQNTTFHLNSLKNIWVIFFVISFGGHFEFLNFSKRNKCLASYDTICRVWSHLSLSYPRIN